MSIIFFGAAYSITAEPVITDKMEAALGAKYRTLLLERYGGELQDAGFTSYVENIGRRIAEASRRKIPFHLTLLNTKKYVAVALPGGYVYFSRGALMDLDNEAQLASLLAHELAHIAKRHGVLSAEKEAGVNRLLEILGWLTGEEPRKGPDAIKRILRMEGSILHAAQSGYSEKEELEADSLGADYASMAGYDPGAMAQILSSRRMAAHPYLSQRIRKIRQHIEKLYRHPYAKIYRDKFFPERYETVLKQLKDKVRAFYYYDLGREFEEKGIHDIAIVEFYQALNHDPEFAAAHNAIGTALMKEGLYDDAAASFSSAVGYDDGSALYYHNLGMAYFSKGALDKAISSFRAAINIDPDYSTAYARMAEAYRQKADYVKATGSAEKALRLKFESLFAHSVLAGVYEDRAWKKDAAREYSILLEFPEYHDRAEKRLSAIKG